MYRKAGKVALGVSALAVLAFVLMGLLPGGEAKRASTLNNRTPGMTVETATFGAGCFWHVESDFRKVEGVVSTTVGYEGGTKPQPTYKDVCSDQTGHAEVVQVEYDPSRVSYDRLLGLFFEMHDPTSMDRQGLDVGSQYRSVIYYHSPEQKEAAEKYRERLEKSGQFSRPIVTVIAPTTKFWEAEEYHQQYYEKKGM